MNLRWLLRIRFARAKRSVTHVVTLISSLLMLALFVGAPVVNAIRQIGLAIEPTERHQALASFYSSTFLFWVVAGGVLDIHLGWQIDLRRMLHLPRSPLQVYLDKVRFGLIGPWVVLLLPGWLWLTVKRSAGPVETLLLGVLFLVLAVLSNQCAGIVSMLLDRATRGLLKGLGVFVLVAAGNLLLILSIKAAMMKESSGVALIGRYTSESSQWAMWRLLPGGIVAGAFEAAFKGDLLSLLFWMSMLATVTFLIGSFEYLLLRLTHLKCEAVDVSVAKKRRPSLIRGLAGYARLSILFKELRNLTRWKVMKVVLFIQGSSMPLMILLLPPTFMLFQVLLCTWLVLFSMPKANLFGCDDLSMKGLFTIPVSQESLLERKNLAVNLIIVCLIVATCLIGEAAGTFTLTTAEYLTSAIGCLSVLRAWDVVGSYCSICYSFPTSRKVADDSESFNVASFLLVFIPPVVMAPFVAAQWVANRIEQEWLGLVGCVLLAAVVVLIRRRLMARVIVPLLIREREALFSKLTLAS